MVIISEKEIRDRSLLFPVVSWCFKPYTAPYNFFKNSEYLKFSLNNPVYDDVLDYAAPGINPNNKFALDIISTFEHASENGFTRGNKCNLNLELEVILMQGKSMKGIRIRDSGKGFPHREYVEMLRQGKRNYVEGRGEGLLNLDRVPLEVFYNNTGNEITILVPEFKSIYLSNLKIQNKS